MPILFAVERISVLKSNLNFLSYDKLQTTVCVCFFFSPRSSYPLHLDLLRISMNHVLNVNHFVQYRRNLSEPYKSNIVPHVTKRSFSFLSFFVSISYLSSTIDIDDG